MELTSLTVKTKGTCDAMCGFATIDGAFHLDKKIIGEIEAKALKQLREDGRINMDNIINPTVTNISIVKPYSGQLYNIRCKVNIGSGWYLDVDLHDYKIEFNLEVTTNKDPSS